MTIIIKDGTIVITDDNPQDYRTTYYTNFPYYQHFYSNICINCPNNPKNGGSGNCNCILGTQVVY
jgi:hypothetical protein